MKTTNNLIKSGIDCVGDIHWGAHICQFYKMKENLPDILLPYFKAGLENNEFCLRLTSLPLDVDETKACVKKDENNFSDYIANGQMVILDYKEWYHTLEKSGYSNLLEGLIGQEKSARKKGFEGLRISGDASWLGSEDWGQFQKFESDLFEGMGKYHIVYLCSYFLDSCTVSDIAEVVNNHESILFEQAGKWVFKDSMKTNRILHLLESSEIRYRRLFETAQDGILILNADSGKIIDVNPYLENMLGYSHKDFLGKRLWEIGPFKDIKTSKAAFQELQNKQYVRYEHLPLETKNGVPIAVEFVSNVYLIDGERVIQCNIRDITIRKRAEEALAAARSELEARVEERTAELAKVNEKLVQEINERKQTERALKESEVRFQTLTENTTDLVWEMNTQGIYTYVNPEVKNILGYNPDEIVGKTPFDFMPEKDRAALARQFERLIKSQKPLIRLENTYVRKDGGLVILETNGVPFFYPPGCLGGYRGIDRDITERKRSQDELNKATKLESISILAGGIAHDFNNMLTGIMGNITLAQKYVEKGGNAYDRLVDAERASLMAKDITQQLLTFSGGGTPIKKPTSISSLLKESVAFALSGSDVRCDFNIPDNLWAADADEAQINRVINNVVINADQAMPEGGVINVSIENVVVKNKSYLPLPKGNYLKIMIKDHGTGIPEKLLPRIFEPYFTTKKKGSGLGLATAYSIIKNHGGYMTIESKLGEGTTIYIYIPATNAPLLEIDEQEDIRYTGGGRRILAMDDEEMIRKLLQNSLTEIGYRVELAGDGSEAIEKYIKAEKSGNPFAAVILDLTIPGGLGGKETIKKLLEINSNIIAIASSGYTNGPVMANYQEYGFRGTVSKPFHIADMEKTLHDVISTYEINTTMTRDVGVLPIPGNGQTRILIMDDSQVVISALSEILPEMGYEVEFARNGDQAISTYQKEKNSGYSFDIVIIDLNISKGLGGEETMKKLLEIDPKIQAIVSSGYPTEAAMLKPDKFGFKAAIAKPYRIEELSEIINKVMHKGNSQLVKGGGVSR
jgi:PAS domain S-box-containing protein